MSLITIPKPLREKLGDEATDALVAILDKFEKETQKELASKDDITKIKLDIADIRSELKLIKWMMGIMLAGVLSLVMKTFFS
jgi:bifunctional DNA-binding transcriptional regulator/antitoxin component of YhaV-PrlF toxin-antitoxin module